MVVSLPRSFREYVVRYVCISVGVAKFLFKFILLGFSDSLFTSPGLTILLSPISVGNPLPSKYCRVSALFNVVLSIPCLISDGVCKFLFKFFCLIGIESSTKFPGFFNVTETLSDLIVASLPSESK